MTFLLGPFDAIGNGKDSLCIWQSHADFGPLLRKHLIDEAPFDLKGLVLEASVPILHLDDLPAGLLKGESA